MTDKILIKGLKQNNLKNISLEVPKEMIEKSNTITARCLRKSNSGEKFTTEELRQMVEVKKSEEKGEEDIAMGELKLRPIGRVESDYGEFKVVLDKKYGEALTGLEGFSHVQVIWWFDGCDNEESRNVMINEKPYTNGPDRIGTFATRSPERPNPIAISTAEILSIDMEKATIQLSYIDAITGTPVLDIKPYTPSADRVNDFKTPSWCSHWPKSYEESGNFDWESEFNF